MRMHDGNDDIISHQLLTSHVTQHVEARFHALLTQPLARQERLGTTALAHDRFRFLRIFSSHKISKLSLSTMKIATISSFLLGIAAVSQFASADNLRGAAHRKLQVGPCSCKCDDCDFDFEDEDCYPIKYVSGRERCFPRTFATVGLATGRYECDC